MRDDHAFNIHFVSLVETYPCLYDNTRNDYNVSQIQERAWNKIAKEIGDDVTALECKSRWKNLRGSYTKHLKNLKNYPPSGSGGSNRRPYYLAEYISFILPFTTTRQPKGNAVGPKATEVRNNEAVFIDEFQTEGGSESSDCEKSGDTEKSYILYDSDEEYSVKNVNEKVDRDVPRENFAEDIEVNMMDENNEEQPRTGKRKDSSSRIRRFKHKRSKYIQNRSKKSALEIFAKQMHVARETPSIPSDFDADSCFLLSLLSDLKEMTDSQKRKFKIGILKLAGHILDETPSQPADLQNAPQSLQG